jgi:hypothetical protein
MEERTAISKEEAEFEKLLATALERERQKLRALSEAHEYQKCGRFEDLESDSAKERKHEEES